MTILITGSSKGIGKELVYYFSENHPDYKIIAISRDNKKLQEIKRDINSNNIYTISFDINNILNNNNELIDKIKEITQQIDILINNAGILINKPFIDFTYKDAQNIFNTNFFAPSALIKTLLPLLRKSTNPHIVNISSMGGFQGSSKFPGLSYYSASKAALANITECIAEEFKDLNIKINCLALGAVQTEMLNNAFPDYKAPLNAKEMAEFIANFSINGSKYFNGKIIPVSLSSP